MDDSPFARLSPELRNMIFKLAVTENTPTYIGFRQKPEPPITRVCKQIREESILVFYREATFAVCLDAHSIKTLERLPRWYESIGPKKGALVKCLVVYTANISRLFFQELFLTGWGSETLLDARHLLGINVQDPGPFRGPQIIRTTERDPSGKVFPRDKALTSEWKRRSDGLYRRVEDLESMWVQERYTELEAADEGLRFMKSEGFDFMYFHDDSDAEDDDDEEEES